METRRSLGEDCLKNDDCLSAACSQLRCAAAPPTIDAQVTHANPGDDATTDGPTADQAASDVVVETASETPVESSPGAPVGGDDTGD